MKITLKTLFEAHPAFELLSQQFFAVNKILKVHDLVDQVNAHYATIARKQEELLSFYGKQGENGDYEMEEEKRQFYEKELLEFLSAEVELDWEPISTEELGDIRLPLPAFALVEFLFLKK